MADTAAATGMNVAEVSHMIGQGAVDAARALREFNILVDQNAKKGTATFKWIDDAGKWQQVTVKAKEQAKVVSTLLDLLDKKFGGTEMRLGKTMAGLLDNIGDIVEMFRKRVGDAGLYQYVKTQFGGFIDWINAKVADGSLDKWARAASDSIIGILEAGRGFALAAPGMAKAIADMVGPLKELEPATLMKLGAALYFLPDGIMIGAGLTQIAGGLTSMIAALQASRNMGVNLLRIATGIAAIGAALYTMDCYRDTFRNFIDSLQPNGGQPIVDLSCCRFHGH